MALSNTLLHPNATKMLSKDQQYIDLIVKDRPEWCRCVCVCVYARTWVCERRRECVCKWIMSTGTWYCIL